MKVFKTAAVVLFSLAVTACSIFQPLTFPSGTPESEVVAKLGRPTNRYMVGNDYLLEYAKGPWGQRTYMARFDANGRLLSYEQVLTVEKFNTIKVNQATKTDVLQTVGAPSETSYLPLRDLEVWTYPYKESNVWNSLMHIHFDREGIVRQMLNGPDPRFDPDRSVFGGLRLR